MRLSIKNIIHPRLPVLLLQITACIAIWIIAFIFQPVKTEIQIDSIVSGFIDQYLTEFKSISFFTSLLITFFNGFLLAQLNNKYTLIRNRTFLPVLIYLLMISVWIMIQNLVCVHMATLLFLLSLFMILGVYRNRQASAAAFSGSFLISLAGFFVFPFTFLIPVYWIGLIQMRGFSLKTFLASVFGFINPWILYFAVKYYVQPDLLWLNNLATLPVLGLTILNESPVDLIYFVLLIVTGLLTTRGLMSEMNKDSLQTRSYLIFLMTLLVSVFVLTLFMPLQYRLLKPVVAAVFAILISHPLSLKFNNFNAIIFYIFCGMNVAYFIIKLTELL